MKMKPMLGAIGAVGAAILLASSAQATILHYTFDPGAYYDFAGFNNTVTGSFDYDTAAGTFSNVDYVRGGDTFTVASSTGPGAGVDQAFFGDTSTGDYDVYQFATPLAGGGTDTITAAFHPAEFVAAGGSVSTTGLAAAAPEPATWAVMVLGFGLSGAMMRRRGTVAAKA